jgi:hypothetical protein
MNKYFFEDKKYTNFLKILIILFFLIIIFRLILKFKIVDIIEKFNSKTCPTLLSKNESQILLPKSINLKMEIDKNKTKVNFTWKKDTVTKDIDKYIIVMYKNNDGPYLIYPSDTEVEQNTLSHNFMNPLFNIKYRFAVVGVNKYGNSPIKEYKEIYITYDNVEINNIKELEQKIQCNPNGYHNIVDSSKCSNNNSRFIQAFNDNKNTDFNNDDHELLLKKLKEKQKIKLNIKF